MNMLCTERDINLKNDKHFLRNHSALSLQNVRFVLCFYGHKVIINYSYTNIRTVEDACPYTQIKYDLNYIFFKDMRLEKYTYEFRGFGQGAISDAHKTCASERNSQKNE